MADRSSKRHCVLVPRISPPWSPRAPSPGDYALPTARGARLAPPPEQCPAFAPPYLTELRLRRTERVVFTPPRLLRREDQRSLGVAAHDHPCPEARTPLLHVHARLRLRH